MAFAAAIAAAVIGAAISAYGQYQAAQAQGAALDYQAKLARNEAIARRQAAEIAAQNARERAERVMGTQRARLGAAGVFAAEGTPLMVQIESAEQAALEEARIRYGGAVEAGAAEAAARLRRFEARAVRRGGTLAAAGSLLQGVGSAYGIYASRGSTDGGFGRTQGADYQAYRRGERGY